MSAAEIAIDDLLQQWRNGDREAHDALMRDVYPVMRAMAQRELGSANGRFTIRATELAHEAYLRLLEQRGGWQDRAHFLAITARVIRRVLIDLVRERQAQKRGSEFDSTHIALAIGDGSPADFRGVMAGIRGLKLVDAGQIANATAQSPAR